jgi:hypothetical protein
MSAVVQTLVVALVVLAAGAYVARLAWRTLRPRKDAGCASGCGCDTAEKDAGSDWARTG